MLGEAKALQDNFQLNHLNLNLSALLTLYWIYLGKAQTNLGYFSESKIILFIKSNSFPDNIVEISFSEYETILEIVSETNRTKGETYLKRSPGRRRGLNLLGLIFLCSAFGAALLAMGDEARRMVELVSVLCKLSVKLMTWVIL